MLHRPQPARTLIASACVVGLAITVSGCAGSTVKTGPLPAALEGTWTCRVEAKEGEHVGSFDDDDDPKLWYYGGDEYRVTIAKTTWSLEGKQNGRDVQGSGSWGKSRLLNLSAAQTIDYEFVDRSDDARGSVTLGRDLTERLSRVKRDSYGDFTSFLGYEARIAVSAAKIRVDVDSIYTKKHGVTCSR